MAQRWGLGHVAFARPLARRSRGACEAGRGGRVHRPLERRDEWARWVHAAGAERGLDGAGAAGTGIVGVFQRGPALLAQEAAALDSASRGRFVLGIGSSSDRIVEGWNGIPFERPLSKVRETLDFLRTALDGERTASGFKLETAPAQRVPIVLAALRGKMLTSPWSAPTGRSQLRPGGLPRWRQLGARGLRAALPLLLPAGEREAVEPLARFMFSSYITVPVYAPSTAGSATAIRSTRWSRPGSPATARPPRRRRPGTDRGDVHLRHPGADEGADRRLRRGRHNPPDPHRGRGGRRSPAMNSLRHAALVVAARSRACRRMFNRQTAEARPRV